MAVSKKKHEWTEVKSSNFLISDEKGRISIFNHSARMGSTTLLTIDKKLLDELIRNLKRFQDEA